MTRNIAVGFVGFLLLITPLFASAQSVYLSIEARQQLLSIAQQLVLVLNEIASIRAMGPGYATTYEFAQRVSQLTQRVLGLQQQVSAVFTGGSQSVALQASPTSGSLPLTVTFTARAGNTWDSYTVDFGDGRSAPISGAYSITHTYTQSGTFTARLRQGGNVVASVTITAGGSYDDEPDITDSDPDPVRQGAYLTLTGSGFLSSNDVYLDGTKVATVGAFSSGRKLEFVVPSDTLGGESTIVVRNANGRSNNWRVTIGGVPEITGTNTDDPTAGSTLIITGKNFTSSNDILLDGSVQQSGVSSTDNGTKISFVIPSNYPTGATERRLTVRASGNTSNAKYIRVRGQGPSVTLSANGSNDLSVAAGQSYTLSYSSQNATSCTMRHADSTGGGSYSVTPNTSGSTSSGLIGYFSLLCTDASGRTAVKSVLIRATPPADVAPSGAPTVSISSNGNTSISIAAGDSYPVTYSSSNASTCTMFYVSSAGTNSFTATANTTQNTTSGLVGYYRLACSNASGMTAKSLIIRLNAPADVTP